MKMNHEEYEEYQELKQRERNRVIGSLGAIVFLLLLLLTSNLKFFEKMDAEDVDTTEETMGGMTEEELLNVAQRSMGVVLTGNEEQDEAMVESYVERVTGADVSEEATESQTQEAEVAVYQQNEAYKMFYGTWEVTGVVCEHSRLGGDAGYEAIIGRQISYGPERYECNGICIDHPEYMMTIFSGETTSSFIDDFIVMDALLPEQDFYVWVQIVNKPSSEDVEYDAQQYGSEVYIGDEFFLKDDNTLYCCDYNCVYELTRVSYPENYDETEASTYQERW